MQAPIGVYPEWLRLTLSPLRSVRRLTLLFAVLLLPGCSTLLPHSYEYGAVDVAVSDMDGAPVTGAKLVLYTGTRQIAYGRSNTLGRYHFSYVPADGYGVYLFPPQGYFVPADSLPYRYVDLPEGGTKNVSFVVQHAR